MRISCVAIVTNQLRERQVKLEEEEERAARPLKILDELSQRLANVDYNEGNTACQD